MDLLTFISELARSAAWPVTTLVVVGLLRKEIRRLIPLITSLKYKDFELVFGREAAEAREEAAQLPSLSGKLLSPNPAISDTVMRLLSTAPRAAVIEAWREVEYEALQAAIRKEVAIPRLPTVSPTRLLNALASYHALSTEQLSILHQLRSLRNEAAHAPEFALTEASARDYAIAAAQLLQHLRSI